MENTAAGDVDGLYVIEQKRARQEETGGRKRCARRSWRRPFGGRKPSSSTAQWEEGHNPLSSSLCPLFRRRKKSSKCATSEKSVGSVGGLSSVATLEQTALPEEDGRRSPSPSSSSKYEKDEEVSAVADEGGCSSSVALSDLSVEDGIFGLDDMDIIRADTDGDDEDADRWEGSVDCDDSTLKGGSSARRKSFGSSTVPSLASSLKSAIAGGWPAKVAANKADIDNAENENKIDDLDMDEYEEDASTEARLLKSAIDSGWPGGSGSSLFEENLNREKLEVVPPGRQLKSVAVRDANVSKNHKNNSAVHPMFAGGGPSKWILLAGGGSIKCDELETVAHGIKPHLYSAVSFPTRRLKGMADPTSDVGTEYSKERIGVFARSA